MSSGGSSVASETNCAGSGLLLPKSMTMSYLPGVCGLGQTSVVFQFTHPGTIGTILTAGVMPGPEMSARALLAVHSAEDLCWTTYMAARGLTSPAGGGAGSITGE